MTSPTQEDSPALTSVDRWHEALANVLVWAEMHYGSSDPLKVQQLRDPINTCHMVVDQLVERNASADGTIGP